MISKENLKIGSIWAIWGLSIAATWTIALQTYSRELEAYRKAEDLDLKTGVERLSDLSKRIAISLDDRAELDAQQKNLEVLDRVTLENSSLKEENAALKADLQRASMKSPSLQIEVGTSSEITPNVLFLAVSDAYTSSRRCDGRFGNQPLSLSLGETVERKVGGVRFEITLTKVLTGACEFNLVQPDLTQID